MTPFNVHDILISTSLMHYARWRARKNSRESSGSSKRSHDNPLGRSGSLSDFVRPVGDDAKWQPWRQCAGGHVLGGDYNHRSLPDPRLKSHTQNTHTHPACGPCSTLWPTSGVGKCSGGLRLVQASAAFTQYVTRVNSKVVLLCLSTEINTPQLPIDV